MEDTGSTDTRSKSLVSALHTYLYRMAERHDPGRKAEVNIYFLEDYLVDTLAKDKGNANLGTASTRAFDLVNLPIGLIGVGDEIHQPFLRVSHNLRGQYCVLSRYWGNAATIRIENATFADRPHEIALESMPLQFDNNLDWNQKAANVANIYANSAVTSSASDSNDSSGGLFISSKDGRNSLFALSPHGNSHRTPGQENSCAWTLQEQLSSPYVLHFSTGAIHSECRTLSASEFDPTGVTHIYHMMSNEYAELRELKQSIAKGPLRFDRPSMEVLYPRWEIVVHLYTSRGTTKPTDRVPTLLGIAKRFEVLLQDEPVAGIWKGAFLSTQLALGDQARWSRGESRSPTDPQLSIVELGFAIGVYRSRITGTISMNGTLRLFRRLDTEKRKTLFRLPTILHLISFKQKGDIDEQREETLEELCVELVFSAVVPEDEKIWCLVVVRIPSLPPPKFGYPAFPNGQPPTTLCLCLAAVDIQQSVFRRVGICEMVNNETFWAGAQRDMRVTIV
ncbi:hypothetical protein MMC13_007834 [Lambiella insularis]|nr:hypothetical protein [Lambiella insularis]